MANGPQVEAFRQEGIFTTVPVSSSGRVPSLDGLRATSILLVLMGHVGGTGGLDRLELGVGDYAHLGVVMFFVISGFLITGLLLSEHYTHGRISLKTFYARRALRIFPASYAFILCVSLLSLAGKIELHGADIWHAATYTINYFPFPSWQLGHLWSLSVEEQFYLLWPLTFLLLGPRRSAWVTAAVVLLGPVARTANWLLLRQTMYYELQTFPVVADALAAGCLLAQSRPWLESRSAYLRLFQPAYSLTLLTTVLILNRFMGYTVVSVFGSSIRNVALAILIHRVVYKPRDCVGRLLNWKPVALIGSLSYSLYLWQQLFLNRKSSAWVNAFPQNLIFSICTALVSFLLLEMPLVKLRHRLRQK